MPIAITIRWRNWWWLSKAFEFNINILFLFFSTGDGINFILFYTHCRYSKWIVLHLSEEQAEISLIKAPLPATMTALHKIRILVKACCWWAGICFEKYIRPLNWIANQDLNKALFAYGLAWSCFLKVCHDISRCELYPWPRYLSHPYLQSILIPYNIITIIFKYWGFSERNSVEKYVGKEVPKALERMNRTLFSMIHWDFILLKKINNFLTQSSPQNHYLFL